MSKRKNDIERYLRGEMTPSEMHALEKEALRDPFLSEALEGAHNAGKETFLFDLSELHNSVRHRAKHRKRGRVISMWNWSLGIAAGLVLLALSSVYIIDLINKKQQNMLQAVVEESPLVTSTPSDDTLRAKDEAETLRAAPSPEASESKKPTSATEGVTQPSNPVAGNTDDKEKTPIARVIQPEIVEKERQKVVEADLTDVPPVLTQREDSRLAKKETSTVASGAAAESRDRKSVPSAAHVVKGRVLSTEDGKPLPGVNVLVKGTKTGTITDAEGNYKIGLPDRNHHLLFSFIGLEDEEMATEGKTELNVEMSPDYAQLSEVVVTGREAIKAEEHPQLQFAEPEGGRNAFEKYLEQQMNYPQQALDNNVEGRVEVEFSVDPDGRLGEFKIISGIGYGCDDELIRLIKEGPAWSPSKRDDRPVKENVKVRLKFDIQNKK